MTTVTHHPIVALNLPDHVPDLVKKGRTIVSSMTGNAHFAAPNPLPTPALADVGAGLDALDAAERATETNKSKEATATRNAALKQARTLLKHLGAYIQLIADGASDYDAAAAIIQSAGVDVHKVTPRQPQTFHAEQGISGTVALFAVINAMASSYLWQLGTDGKTWTDLPATTRGQTAAHNLTPGTTYYFRFQPVLRKGQVAEWSQSISLLVK